MKPSIPKTKTRSPTKIGMPKGMLPQNLKTTLRYRAMVNIDPGAGALSYYVFRANGLYDPDYTGVGHQPLGYDQLGALYSHYVVLRSRITAHFRSFDTSNKYFVVNGVLLSSSIAPIASTWYTLAEQNPQLCKYTVVDDSISTSGGIVPALRGPAYDARKFFGCKDPADEASQIGAAIGANPADCAYFIVFLQAPAGYDIPSSPCIVEIDYDVEFLEPEEVAGS